MKINPAVLFLALISAVAGAATGASFFDDGATSSTTGDSEGNHHQQVRQVHVKHNFLQNFQEKYANKNEREEAAYEIIDRGHIETPESSSCRTTRSDRYQGKVRLSSAFLNSLKNHVGIFSPEDTHDSPYDVEVSMHTYVKSSAVHRDHYTASLLTSSDHRSPSLLVREDRDVAFVFLNTNKDAYFQHGDTSVPIKEGSLVHFNGRVPHNTVIKSGTVEMIGPFELNPLGGKRGVVSVGYIPPETSAPSDSPSAVPTVALTTTAPSDSPSAVSTVALTTTPKTPKSPKGIKAPKSTKAPKAKKAPKTKKGPKSK